MDDLAPLNTGFDPVSIEEVLDVKLNDKFYAELCPSVKNGERLSFGFYKNGILLLTMHNANEIVVPHSVKELILYINHYQKLAGGSHKIYHRIRKDFYWQTIVVDYHSRGRRLLHFPRHSIELLTNFGKL